jgi:hypothetical protein
VQADAKTRQRVAEALAALLGRYYPRPFPKASVTR